MTPLSTELEIRRVRHPLKLRPLTVARVHTLTPHMVRLTLAGESLADFSSDGFDDHVKLMLPAPGSGELRFPPAGPDGRPDWEASDLPRPIMRDYTPRRFDRTAHELDIDFALHGSGPAARWAAAARPGDAVHIAGPRGSMVVPTDLQWQWLIGDDAALPAIARRLEELDASAEVTVVVLGAPGAALPPLMLDGPRRLVLATDLAEAVRALPTPHGRGHAFAAGEHHAMQAVREVLVSRHALSGKQIRASAYWRHGASGHHENLEG